ncbi:hypothetical protein [Cyanobium sp. NIES-981]|uniref:hypothetical protein n=1 Tax=Cyanobium sp. NIES-981 TaxID=1851505 RepID=UPI0007DDCB7B|nr:hypothetical protein [Cyanobium sp. NIES-981]SBO44827.1 protein of unknown function [Cyanobium sp. NIES-981]
MTYRIAIAAAVLCLLAGLRHHPLAVKAWVHGPLLITWTAAITLLIAGSIAEKHHSMRLEENLELAGEALVAFAALLHRRRLLLSRPQRRGGPG